MRQARIKVAAESGEAVYHCLSRSVNGEWLFDEPAREVLRRQLWLVAEYCGLEILTYAILSNHFHVLVRVPRRVSVPDQEPVSYTHLRAHETDSYLVCRLLLEKKKTKRK